MGIPPHCINGGFEARTWYFFGAEGGYGGGVREEPAKDFNSDVDVSIPIKTVVCWRWCSWCRGEDIKLIPIWVQKNTSCTSSSPFPPQEINFEINLLYKRLTQDSPTLTHSLTHLRVPQVDVVISGADGQCVSGGTPLGGLDCLHLLERETWKARQHKRQQKLCASK